MRALHFGAGNIGRGFIGKLLAEAGHEVILADVLPSLIDELSSRKKFRVNVVGESCTTDEVTITGAVYSNKDEVLDEIVKADLITTAVGPRILERLAPTIAKAITMRRAQNVSKPLNIIACENAIRATSTLRGFVVKELDPETAAWCKTNVGFVDSAVDRIVPPARHDDILEVTVEEFCEWVVDETQFVGDTRPYKMEAVKFTNNLDAFVERKLMTVNTGHAVCAYIGKLYGYVDIRSSINDPTVRSIVEGAMLESGKVLCRRYGMNEDEHTKYIQKILRRFANPYIKDDVLRVGREPIRKLSQNDRLIKPLLGCLDYGLPCDNLVKGVAAALLYTNPDDPQAVQLQELVKEKGMTEALVTVSGMKMETGKNSIEQVALAARELSTTSVAQI